MQKSLRIITKRIVLVVAFVLIAFTGWTQAFQNGVRKGVIKVKFSPAVTRSLSNIRVNARSKTVTTGIAAIDAVAQATSARNMYRLFPENEKNANKLHKHGLDLWYVVEIDEDVDPQTAVAQFKNLQQVILAEVDHQKVLSPFQAVPYTTGVNATTALPFNDPLLKDQWHYNNTGQVGDGDADINLFEAWTKTAGANNIIVSVHDQGIDVAHKDLRSNIWVNTAELSGAPGVDDDRNGYIDDVNGYNFQKRKGAVDAEIHGTHVAGTIAAVNNNGIGVSGIAGGTGNNDGVKLMSLQIFGGLFENSYIYAADNGAVISQNSWGYTSPFYFDQSIKDAIDYFIAEAGNYTGSPMKGGIVIFAAGNSNSDSEWYPAYYENVLSVSSFGADWKRAYYSNYGAWVEIAAPGGDQDAFGTRGGVLSTAPKDQYAYLQGTSMACPHVAGIAALALANRDKQLTNTELWNQLLTGVVSIDAYNPDFVGKLGTGAIDAAMAIQNDLGLAPAAVTNLTVKGIAQEFATLSWSVPADNDDNKPASFQLYYATQPITASNLSSATKITIANKKAAGETAEYEVDGLLGLTTYYFALTSTDRWGNVSALSNIASETTNEGPAISVDQNSQSINLTIDVASSTTATHPITILNGATGILRWNHFLRHRSTEVSFDAANIHYPAAARKATPGVTLGNLSLPHAAAPLQSNEPVPMAFTEISKTYSTWPTNIIGETDLSLTNSAAVKFSVTEADGFNLTEVRTYLKHDPAKGPVVLEIYKGDAPVKGNLFFAQEYSMPGKEEGWAYITLNEQLYFTKGETFWVVIHVPARNLYPLGIGFETEASGSKNCLISFNMGATWQPLEEALNDKNFAWVISAVSQNATLGRYITLDPGSGDVEGMGSSQTTIVADAATLINGSYDANLVITSNDLNTRELRIPVSLTVRGHQPNIKHIDIADFGSVFLGQSKTLELVLDNRGYGNFNNPTFDISGSNFTVEAGTPWQIKALSEAIVNVTFTPTQSGNTNGTLTISNGNQTYQISLFGIGAETSRIAITPLTQTKNNLAIGDQVSASITVQNNGAYPLKYFVPGFDSKGVSTNWPTDYHAYGYKVRSNRANDADPIPYGFQNISSTGIDITAQLNTEYKYFTIDMGFDFPYYNRTMNKLYVTQSGFTTFDNSVNPINSPSLNNSWNPRGYISLLGGRFALQLTGKIFYKIEADRVIVQYDNLWDGYAGGTITAQLVLVANGDIRFYYDNMGYGTWEQQTLTILIEDYDQQDGILVHNWNNPIELYSGMAIGFDYPGPDIIKTIENGSGIVAPGNSATVNITLNTDQLPEGMVKRYVNFVSNDPLSPTTNSLIELEINQGGTPQPTLSTDTLAFGNVFQGAVKSASFIVKNNGTKDVNINSLTFVNQAFTVQGDQPAIVKPGLYARYDVVVPTNSLAVLEDWLSVNYADGSHDTVYVTAHIVDAPAIQVDLSVLQQTLAYGDSLNVPFDIQNTGAGTLEVAVTGKQWLSFEAPVAATEITYAYEKENTGGVYQWIDIRKSGTHLPFWDIRTEDGYWRTVQLPFPIEYYGVTYHSFKIGDNGLISFEENPAVNFFTDKIPTDMLSGPCIFPYWTFSGFSDMYYPTADIGIFYKFYDDKIVVTWSYFINNFGGMGDPVSAQVIFYKNGTMKFQYRVEEGGTDLTSQVTAIGLQQDSQHGVYISDHLPLDHGQGLAYVIIPAKKLAIAPHTTVTGSIKLDARNVYGGAYSEMLHIQSNAPGNELLAKPVELTVAGHGEFTAPDTVKFGQQMIMTEFGSPKVYTADIELANEGTAPYTITWAALSNGMQNLNLMLEVDGFFGKEWTYISNIYSPWAWETPTFTILPGDVLKAKAAFYPNAAGDFADELVFSTSMGDQHIVLMGSAIEPPALTVQQDSISVILNTTTETVERTIDFNNIGVTDLTYALRVEYSREAPDVVPASESTSTPASTLKLTSTKASDKVGIQALTTYNRTLKHTTKNTPDTFVGNGGTAITLATKYIAGVDGFNVTHINTYMRRETVNSGTLEVAVRAGGASIASSPIVATGKITFSGTGNDQTGTWYEIKLDRSAVIYPNEEFYISVSYPFGIQNAQGSITDSETTPRYYYEEEGYWYDVQKISDLETIGWMMVAAEEKQQSWLSITTSTQGTLASGDAGVTTLRIDGASAQRGDQFANLVFATNDPMNPAKKVPVTLHVNEGPVFSGGATTVIVSEGEVVTLNFTVTDREGHSFTVAPEQNYAHVSHVREGSNLKVTLSPDYASAGDYTYIFKGTDQFNAVTELTLAVEVMQKNQPPVYVGENETKSMEFSSVGRLFEYNLADYFADPDGDAVTFTLAASAAGVADVFASADKFLVRPVSVGQSKLAFAVTDSKGAVLHDTLTLRVDAILATEDGLIGGIKVYPNPVQQVAHVYLSYEWKDEVKLEIVDATGQQYAAFEVNTNSGRDLILNVASLPKGFYVLRATANNKVVSIKLIKE